MGHYVDVEIISTTIETVRISSDKLITTPDVMNMFDENDELVSTLKLDKVLDKKIMRKVIGKFKFSEKYHGEKNE